MDSTVQGALVSITVLLAAVFYIFRKRRPDKYPPGPPGLPFIGNLHQLGSKPFKTFMKMKKTYGDIIAIDFARFRGVVLNDYKVIREALSKPEFNGRPPLQIFVDRCGGDRVRGVGFNDGTPWLEQRRFALKTLRDFGFGRKSTENLIHQEITELLTTLSEYNGRPFKTENFFNAAVVNSLWLIIAGERFSHDDKELLRLVELIKHGVSNSAAAGGFIFFPWICKLFPNLSGYNTFVGFQLGIIDMMREKYNEHKLTYQPGQEPRDYLDVTIREILATKDVNSSFFQEEGERSSFVTLMDLFIGGIETTSTALSWAVLFLAINPDVQEKLFNEIELIVGLSRLPSLEDKPKMEYTETVILETLRLANLSPLTIHRTTQDVVLRKYEIPKDTIIIPNLYGAHKDAEVWGDPDNFRPERFILCDGAIIRHHEALIPFGAGKRVCLGETLARNELFLFLTSIFQRFRIEPNPAKPTPTVDYFGGFILFPKPYEYVVHDRF